MNVFNAFLQADWAELMGWTLLHSLWQIAMIAGVCAVVSLALRNGSANVRYVCGCVALLAMLAFPVGTYVLLSHNRVPAPTPTTEASHAPPAEAPPATTESPTTPIAVASAESPVVGPATPPAPHEAASGIVLQGPAMSAPAAADEPEPVVGQLYWWLRSWLPWATAVWILGVSLLSIRPLWGWLHVGRLQRRGISPLPDKLGRLGEDVIRRLGVRRAVRLARSALVEAPTVVGHLRPIVLLPASAITGLSVCELELILTHELAHVRRHDYLVNLVQTVIESLLFYHPGMWWVSSWIRRERENCCDDMAVTVSGDRTTYVQALARLEEHRSVVGVSALGATGGSLLGRVRRLMGKPNGEFGYGAAAVWLAGLACLLVGVVLATGYADGSPQDESVAATEDDEADAFVSAYQGPCDVAASPDGKRLYVVESDARALAVVSVAEGKVVRTIPLPSQPTGVCVSADGKSVYITCGVARGLLCVVDTASGKVIAQVPVGHSPRGPSVSPDGKTAYVCNRFDNDVSVVDLVAGKEAARVNVLREPFDSAFTPDGKTLFVTNHLPIDQADAYDVACEVTCIDTSTLETKQIRLCNGATNLRGVCVSPDGKYVYIVSVLARYQMPRTQLERGWAVTSALSIIDAEQREYINTLLLDDIDLGGADPYDVATSADGATLYVTHAGTHEVTMIDAKSMLDKLLALPPDQAALEALRKAAKDEDQPILRSSITAENVPNDLAFLMGMRQRVALEGVGPRGLAVVGNKVYCAMYFSDTLDCVDVRADPEPTVIDIALGPTPVMTEQRKGKLYFQDARLCFQQWLSCATCHPDGRTDGLNWDLMNDGMGNPKNVKSMLLAHETPPMMISGVRADAETAVRAAFLHIQFEGVPEEKAKAVDAYLKSLEPTPSPYLVDGALSESARRGKALFDSERLGCATCHPAPLYTDLKMHELGRGQYDRRDDWDTPTLIECWRTAPYLHDGRHVTMKEVFSLGNHGGASDKLTAVEIDDLTEFVLSLSGTPTDEKLQEKSTDNPLSLDDDTLINLYHTGKALGDAAWECASYYRRHDRMPREVSEKDPFAPQQDLRLVLSEDVPGLVQIWSVGPDGDWDGGRQIDSTKQPLDGDLGVEMNRDTRAPREYLADDLMVRLLEGKRLSHYLAAKGPGLPKPELEDDGLLWGPVVDGLQLALELTPKKDAYYLGEVIDVRFRVRNTADYAIMIGLTTNYHREMTSDNVFIHDAKGKRLRGSSADLMGMTGIRHQTLKPGETASYDSADLALVAPGRRASGWPLAHQAEAAPGVYTVRFKQSLATGGSDPLEWVGELETAPVTIRIAEYPKFAIHRVAAYFDRSGSSTHILGLRDSGNGPQRDAMRLKKHRLDDLVLDGVPLLTEKDILFYRWEDHVLWLTPEAHERLTMSIKPGDWGIPFVVQAEGQPIYQGTFYTTGSKYSVTMPAVSLDPLLMAPAVEEESPASEADDQPRNVPRKRYAGGHIRIENRRVFEEGEPATDPREDERVLQALKKAGRLDDPPGVEFKDPAAEGRQTEREWLAIDFIRAEGDPPEAASFWIDYEQLSEDALRERVARLLKSSPELTIVLHVDREVQSERIVAFLDLLKTVGAKRFAFSVLPVDSVFAIHPGPGRDGAIRGKVIGPDKRGQPGRYVAMLDHEAWTNNLGELPNMVVAAGETFEFRNVPAGKCKVRAQPVIASGPNTGPAPTAVEVEVVVKSKQVVEVELTCDDWFASSAWGTAVDGVRVRLTKATGHWERSDRPLPGLLLFYDARNEGSHILHLPENGLCHQVEVDGQWYEWVDPRHTARESDEPFSSRGSVLLDFEPGRRHENKRVDVAGAWRAIPKGKEGEYATRQHSGFVIADDDYGKELVLTLGKHRVRVAVACPSARAPFHGVIRAVSEAVEVEILELELEAAEAPAPPARQVVRPMDTDSRGQFLAVERIARLSDDEQAKQLSRLYKDLAPRYMNPLVEGILSSYRSHILDPTNFDGPGGDHTTTWAQQLADAAGEMSPEEVADKLEIGLWLNIAARARAIQVLKEHADATAALIEADLSANQEEPVERAAATILSLDLRTFTDRLLTMYIEDADAPEEIFRTLLFLHDPTITRPLLEEVEKDPKFLVRCAGLFQGPLYREPAEPLLLDLLNSSDVEIRYAAVYSLYECSDPLLAQPAVELAREKEVRLRSAAAQLASNLPGESFVAVREELLPLLSDEEEAVRFDALRCFAQQKDMAAGPVILELLRRDQIADQHKVTVMQAISKLADSNFNYYMHEWGPDRPANQAAIEKFEAWLQESPRVDGQDTSADRAAWGEVVNGLQAGLATADPRQAYQLGQNVPLVFLLRNTTDKPIALAHNRVPVFINWDNYRRPPGPQLFDPGGSQVYPASGVGGLGLPGTVKRTIAPGEVITMTTSRLPLRPEDWTGITINLLTYRVQPGKHRVSLSYEFDDDGGKQWGGTVTTGVLELHVHAADTPLATLGAEWGKYKDGVRCRLNVDKTRLRAGEPPILLVDLQNHGQGTIEQIYYCLQFTLQVDGKWAGKCSPVEVGGPETYLRPDQEWINVPLVLQDDHYFMSETASDPAGPAMFSRLLEPGRHTIRVDIDGVISNAVDIEIVADDAEAR